MITEIPGLARSPQSLIPLGFPLRTTKTIVDVYGAELFGSRFCQSLFTRPDFSTMASMSPDSASVTTSASRPSITDRACLPEPPCDWLTSSVCPVFCFHWSPNTLLTSWYSSRVGSYDTFSSFT